MSNGKIKRKVKPTEYDWMSKGNHGTWVHPDDVKEYLANGYKKSDKPKPKV